MLTGWIGTALQVAGAIGLATRFLPPRSAYMVMAPGAVIWFAIAVATGQWSLAAMQAIFTAINITGAVRWRR